MKAYNFLYFIGMIELIPILISDSTSCQIFFATLAILLFIGGAVHEIKEALNKKNNPNSHDR